MSLEEVREALPEAVPEDMKEGRMPTRAALLQADRPDLAAAIRVFPPTSHPRLHAIFASILSRDSGSPCAMTSEHRSGRELACVGGCLGLCVLWHECPCSCDQILFFRAFNATSFF